MKRLLLFSFAFALSLMSAFTNAQTRNIQGKITLQGLAQSEPFPPIYLEVWQPGTSVLLKVMPILPDANGNYAASIPLNSEVSLKPNGWLRQVRTISEITSHPLSVNFDLSGGDTNKDNKVDDFDLANVIFSFEQHDCLVDVTGDGIINDFDLATVIFNFSKLGSRSILAENSVVYVVKLREASSNATISNALVMMLTAYDTGEELAPFINMGDGNYMIVASEARRIGWTVISPTGYYPQNIRYHDLTYQAAAVARYDKSLFAVMPIPVNGSYIDLGTAYLFNASGSPPQPNRP